MKEKSKGGRPSEYTDEIADKICEMLATSDRGLSDICMSEDMPGRSTVYQWLNANKGFADKYARAKDMQADYMAELVLKVSKDDSKDMAMGAEGMYPNGVAVQRSRLLADNYKWAAAKLSKRYSPKADLTVEVIKLGKELADEEYTDD